MLSQFLIMQVSNRVLIPDALCLCRECGGRTAPNGNPGWERLLVDLVLGAFATDGGALYHKCASMVAAYVKMDGG